MKDPRKGYIQTCNEHKNPNEAATLSIKCRLRQPKITGKLPIEQRTCISISTSEAKLSKTLLWVHSGQTANKNFNRFPLLS